jgi:hypothetical protein
MDVIIRYAGIEKMPTRAPVMSYAQKWVVDAGIEGLLSLDLQVPDRLSDYSDYSGDRREIVVRNQEWPFELEVTDYGTAVRGPSGERVPVTFTKRTYQLTGKNWTEKVE